MRDREAKHSGGNKRAIGVVDSVHYEAHVQLQAKGARVDKEAKREARMDRAPKVQQYDPNMPEADLKALVLDKFETGAEGGGERRYWSKKELAEVTRQRPAHLGVALEELCDYVKTELDEGRLRTEQEVLQQEELKIHQSTDGKVSTRIDKIRPKSGEIVGEMASSPQSRSDWRSCRQAHRRWSSTSQRHAVSPTSHAASCALARSAA